MIHSGGAYGGHYSAYIKDFEEDDAWYHFNDTWVKRISITELENAFGQVQNARNKRFAVNHANAYMLMYRLVQKTETIAEISLNEIDEELQKEVE
jgi:ubiquitin C-terminal hydrolase